MVNEGVLGSTIWGVNVEFGREIDQLGMIGLHFARLLDAERSRQEQFPIGECMRGRLA